MGRPRVSVRAAQDAMLAKLDAMPAAKARRLIRAVALVLWPKGGGAKDTAEWNSDTTESLSGTFRNFEVHPEG